MKHILLAILAFCITISFVACNSVATPGESSDAESVYKADDSTEEASSEAAVSEVISSVSESASEESEHIEPPCVLRFTSLGDVDKLRSMIDEPENVAREYLDKMHYSMNGLNNRDDIKAMFELLDNSNILYLSADSGFEIGNIEYYVESAHISCWYDKDGEQIQVLNYLLDSPYIAADKKNFSENTSAITNDGVSPLKTAEISGYLVKLYTRSENTVSFWDIESNYIRTPNTIIRIFATNRNNFDVESLNSGASITPFGERRGTTNAPEA